MPAVDNLTIKKKWRGIETTQTEINEDAAVTIVNRLGQKSISLPRIDDKKRWAGYPGLAGTAKKIAKLIPSSITTTRSLYVEPFAGTAKVYQELVKWNSLWNGQSVLNDTSKFVTKWLKREFPAATVTKLDFLKCIKKYDSEQTIFIIDPPWVKSYYMQKFSSFNRDTVKDYSQEIVEACKSIKGKFIITSREENIAFKKAPFRHKTIKSIYVVSGKYPKVLLTHNLDK